MHKHKLSNFVVSSLYGFGIQRTFDILKVVSNIFYAVSSDRNRRKKNNDKVYGTNIPFFAIVISLTIKFFLGRKKKEISRMKRDKKKENFLY